MLYGSTTTRRYVPPYTFQIPGPAPARPGPPSPYHYHHGLDGYSYYDGLGDLGVLDPLGIGIDLSNPLVLGAIGLGVWYFFFRKGRR